MRLMEERKAKADPKALTGEAFWDMRAPSFSKHAKETGYAEAFINMVKPDKSMTVLDMGCGGGTLAIPMAALVKEITAVDFSGKMLDIVKSGCEAHGIENVRTVKCSWTDDWAAAGLGNYDIAISSRSLAVDDIRAAAEKLNAAAKKRVYISTVVGNGPIDRRVYEAVGRELPAALDYVVIYNILYQMGIYGHIDFIEESHARSYDTYDEAFASTRWMFQNMTSEEEFKLAEFMKAHLIQRDGKWTTDYSVKNKWALIWWDKA